MNKKGFTLSELLIVLAIVSVLVLISIPVFASQTERSAESADISNIKSAKSAASAQYFSGKDLDGNLITINGFTCYFDASSGILKKDIPTGYGRGTKSDGGCEDTCMVVNPTTTIPQIAYTSQTDVENKYLSVYINSEGTIKISWEDNANSKDETSESSVDNEDASISEEEEGYVPPEDAVEFIMTKSNRNMAGYKSTSFVPESVFEYNGVKYYFKGYEANSLTGYSGIITIPESVTYIADNAFYSINKIKGFDTTNNKYYTTLNNGKILANYDVTKIIRAAYNQSDFVIPSTVTEIAPWAFKSCSQFLRSLTIPDSVTSIGEGAFYGCNYLQQINIPGSVKTLKKDTIHTSTGTIIVLNEGVESIESGAIYTANLNITVPSTIKNIYSDSIKFFSKSNKLEFIYNGSTYTTIAEAVAAVNNGA